jgi:N-formylglutamate deformylase
MSWLTIKEGNAPLIISLPHTGIDLPDALVPSLHSIWRAQKDADWWIDKLYAFTQNLGATLIHTNISRTMIDVNRDPSGVSLYPGQNTTELCPTTTFDGEPLYKAGYALNAQDIASRKTNYFDPYHAAISAQIKRLRAKHNHIVMYDCHSIRSTIPRLFDGQLPVFNIGTNSGASCHAALQEKIADICVASPFSSIVNGRFKGGFITRNYGKPEAGVHVVQMELACRGYMHEKDVAVHEQNFPPPYDEAYAAPISAELHKIMAACLDFTKQLSEKP